MSVSAFGMRVTVVILVGLLAASLIISTAAAQGGDDATVVARVGSEVVTVADVNQVITMRRLRSRGPEADRERVAGIVEELIVDRLVSEEAPRVSLRNEYAVITRMRHALTLQATTLFDRDYLLPRLRIDSVTIDSFYEANVARYTASRDQRWVRHITVPLPGHEIPDNYSYYVDPVYEGWEPERKIDSIYTRLANGEDFATLARTHSEEPHSKGADGNMGWTSVHSLSPGPFADTCLSLPLYKISHPFKSPQGWHIVQVTRMRSAGPVPIDQEIATDIARLIAKDQTAVVVAQVADSLKAAGTITIFDDALAIPDEQLDPGTPLALVNGRDTIYAAEYLIDKASLQSKRGGGPLTVDQKREVLSTGYYSRSLWQGMLRDLGYYDTPEIQELLKQQETYEQEELVRLRLSASDVMPDSAAISTYYYTHREDFLNPPQTLNQAWSRIRSTLRTRMQDEERQRRIRALERRHGVTRYPDRLAAIKIIGPE